MHIKLKSKKSQFEAAGKGKNDCTLLVRRDCFIDDKS